MLVYSDKAFKSVKIHSVTIRRNKCFYFMKSIYNLMN